MNNRDAPSVRIGETLSGPWASVLGLSIQVSLLSLLPSRNPSHVTDPNFRIYALVVCLVSFIISVRTYRKFSYDSIRRRFVVQRGAKPLSRVLSIDVSDVDQIIVETVYLWSKRNRDYSRSSFPQPVAFLVTKRGQRYPIFVEYVGRRSHSAKKASDVANNIGRLVGLPVKLNTAPVSWLDRSLFRSKD